MMTIYFKTGDLVKMKTTIPNDNMFAVLPGIIVSRAFFSDDAPEIWHRVIFITANKKYDYDLPEYLLEKVNRNESW